KEMSSIALAMGSGDLAIERARALGVADRPIVRQAIADLISFVRVNEWTAARARAARLLYLE
ncbi:hypothetical protein, partial [Klebsiella aerogenes]|uniref:hypothetical protein n=1 Tax=Klebsiella aerogenes TaxID=548 RepID=UPI001953A95B